MALRAAKAAGVRSPGRAAIAARTLRTDRWWAYPVATMIGMGVLPLEFPGGVDAMSLGLTGEETYAVRGLAGTVEVPRTVTVTATGPAGTREFPATVRIDTPVTPTPAPTRPGQCSTSDLKLRIGQANGAAGTVFYPVEFTNTSSTACTMYGYPGVAFVTKPGAARDEP